MQILQWLFKKAQEQERNSSTFNLQHKKEDINEKNCKGKEISSILLKRIKKYEWRKHGYKNLKIFTFLYRKDIPKACFYSTINTKRIGFHRRRFLYSMKMKKVEESSKEKEVNVNKTDSTVHVGNKVLPILEAVATVERNNDQCDNITLSKDQVKGDKKKPISRMKELLRWAASAKSEKLGGKFNGKKVFMFRRRGNLKTVPDEDQLSIDSPKISFRWDLESCSTTSSAYSAISMASSSRNNGLATSNNQQIGHSTCRKGNWITTDSDFVVLEL